MHIYTLFLDHFPMRILLQSIELSSQSIQQVLYPLSVLYSSVSVAQMVRVSLQFRWYRSI